LLEYKVVYITECMFEADSLSETKHKICDIASEVELANDKLKSHKSPGIDQIPA